MRWAVLAGILLVFGGCMSNGITLELLINVDAGAGNLITASQFLFISLEGLLVHLTITGRGPVLRRMVPLRAYAELVVVFFLVSVINNKALDYQIPMPLHMVIRSGSLIVSFTLSVLVLRKPFRWASFFCVMVVTLGIVVATMTSARPEELATMNYDVGTWGVGVAMLIVSLFLSGFLGIFQERIYATYGAQWHESLFYSHFLALPGFVVLARDIVEHMYILTERSTPLILGGVSVPNGWVFLLLNVITQYLCIRGVYMLSGLTDALTTTMTISVRKFASLVFSVVYFNNRFTRNHWIATGCVFVGSLVFSLLPRAHVPKKKTQ